MAFSKMKIKRFQKMNSFVLKNINFQKTYEMTPHQNLKSDGNRNCIVTCCSYSAKMKLQYMKNTSVVAQFHIK